MQMGDILENARVFNCTGNLKMGHEPHGPELIEVRGAKAQLGNCTL